MELQGVRFGVCLPGQVLFTIQSWVWSLFTWARLIYNTVLGLEFVYLGTSYLQYSLGFEVCLPGHVLFTIQSSVWSLFTWARLIYNTVFSLEFVYLGTSYLQYSLGKKHKEESGHVQATTHKYCHSFGFLWVWSTSTVHFQRCKNT